jgi:hypothetical protein
LVSYPYYAKCQRPGYWTFFRHIHINIPDLAKAGRAANQFIRYVNSTYLPLFIHEVPQAPGDWRRDK